MVTKEVAVNSPHGTVFHHIRKKNADGTPYRCRVNGQCKVWKTRPAEFRLPVKHGFYGPCFYITHLNNNEWLTEEELQNG